jgi:hypothetical protein
MMTTSQLDPYATLGVPRGASARQIRDAYRRLAKRFHPDLHADAQTTERMQRINQAWETLSSPTERARYDAQSAAPVTAYPHWNSGRPAPVRTAPAQGTYWSPRPSWETTQPYADAESWRDDDPSPLRWGLLLLAIPLIAFPLFLLFGAVVPLPVLGLLVFFAARILFRPDD